MYGIKERQSPPPPSLHHHHHHQSLCVVRRSCHTTFSDIAALQTKAGSVNHLYYSVEKTKEEERRRNRVFLWLMALNS